MSNEILSFLFQLNDSASIILKRARSEQDFQIHKKKVSDIFTDADIAVEKNIIEAIQEKFPDHHILSEETFPDTKTSHEHLWIIDPIDGTTNFANNLSYVAISIAYAHKGVVQAALVSSPFLNQVFHATKNGGAFLNKEPLSCSSISDLKNAVIGVQFPRGAKQKESGIQRIASLCGKTRALRHFGAIALDLCNIAAGRMHGCYGSIAPWDIAAGALIAREAGAKIGHYNTEETTSSFPEDLSSQNLIVADPGIFDELKKILEKN